jgi:hypothetical protein
MSHIMPLSQITYGIASIIYFSLFLALLYGALVVVVLRKLGQVPCQSPRLVMASGWQSCEVL